MLKYYVLQGKGIQVDWIINDLLISYFDAKNLFENHILYSFMVVMTSHPTEYEYLKSDLY
jgi:hypothetical protein